jgi:hypothetical protein
MPESVINPIEDVYRCDCGGNCTGACGVDTLCCDDPTQGFDGEDYYCQACDTTWDGPLPVDGKPRD